MTEALRRAFELAQQQSEEEQDAIAQFIFEEFQADERWNELLNNPKSTIFLEKQAEQARKEYSLGLTSDLDELL